MDRMTWSDMFRSLPPIPQLGTTAHRQDATCNESRLGGQQECGGICDDIAVWAIAEGMNAVQRLSDGGRVVLFRAPPLQHWCPYSSRTHSVHSNGIACII